MFLTTDRDLLIIEPTVFTHAAIASTILLETSDGVVADTTLDSAGADFEVLDIDLGHVAVVNGVPVEIVSRTLATQLEISLPRAKQTDPTIGPGDGSALELRILSFNRLIMLAQDMLLLTLGIDANHPTQPLNVSAILNPDALGRAIALATIERAFALAAAMATPADQTLIDRAALYARLTSKAMHQTICLLDLDGDGVADATRRLDVVSFVRN